MDRPLPRKILRLVLLGRTGAGKSSAVGTILPHGLSLDTPEDLRRSVRRSGERNFLYDFYSISIVDTPDWLSPAMSDDDVVADVSRCCSLSAPGPHAFLLAVPLTEPSREDRRWIKLIQEIFGTGALNYIILLFTHSAGVSESVDQLIDKGDEVLRDLVTTCGNRFHEFNDGIANGDAQVKTMLRKVQYMVRGNGSTFYCGHSRASMFLTTTEEETREKIREAVETMRRGQGLLVEVKQEETERGIGRPGQEEVKREDTDQRNGSEEANHWERTNVHEGEEKETEQARDEKEEEEKGQVAQEEMQKRRKREETTTEESGAEGRMKSDGARQKSRKEEKKKRKNFLVEGVMAEKKGEEKERRSSLQGADVKRKKMEKMVTEEVGVKRQKKKKRKRNQEEDDREGRSEQKESRRKKRRSASVNVEEEEQPGPSYQFTPGQRKKVQKPTYCSPLKKGEKADIWTWDIYKAQLPVTCADKKGMLNREKLAKGEKCIMADDRWLTPHGFEKYGGKESNKNWKSSIKCQGTILGKLIKDHSLLSPDVAKISSKGKTKAKRVLYTNEPETSFTDDEEENAEQEPDRSCDSNDEMVFEVACGAVTGMFHKRRFASGTRGKSVRTQKSWMTPVEFVKEGSAQPDAYWKKDIQWEGKPLNVLIEKDVLKLHSLNCDCTICISESLEDHRNDDECFVCRSEGERDLVVCEQCPRSFHQLCHLPNVEDAILGDSNPWICTFCVFEASKQWRYPQQWTEEKALSLQTSDRLLECQYLLLFLYSGVKNQITATKPSLNVKGYAALIKTPKRLDKVAEKLQQNHFQTVRQFVSKVLLIFTDSATFNRDDTEVQTTGVKLKDLFQSEFHKVFSIQQ